MLKHMFTTWVDVIFDGRCSWCTGGTTAVHEAFLEKKVKLWDHLVLRFHMVMVYLFLNCPDLINNQTWLNRVDEVQLELRHNRSMAMTKKLLRNVHNTLAAVVVHFNFRAGSTFLVPVSTVSPGNWVYNANTQ